MSPNSREEQSSHILPCLEEVTAGRQAGRWVMWAVGKDWAGGMGGCGRQAGRLKAGGEGR